MEQHPVPQNVTTFQFRLIGDMTLKQFGYLCAGGILGFISYKLPLPFFFTWPAAAGFTLLGVGFAFVPVEERPMDVWVFSFFKSIYSPTQYIWTQEIPRAPKTKPIQTPKAVAPQQHVAAPTPTPTTHTQNSSSGAILSGIFGQATQPATTASTAPPSTSQSHVIASQPKMSLFAQLQAWMNPPKHTPSPTPHPTHMVASAPMPSVTGRHIDVAAPVVHQAPTAADTAKVQQEMSKLEGTVTQLRSELATKTMTDDRIVELQKQLTDLLSERSNMEEELSKLRRTMATQTPKSPVVNQDQAPPIDQTVSQSQQPTVSVINTQAAAIKSGLPRLTTTPNVITGIIKDNTNNFLPAILVTVTNRENLPMRALKTNKLGQFAASTPLPNDVYIIEAEDPRGRFTFDRVQITLNGAVVPAIEIIAKSERQITREKLTQEIFGKNQL